MKHLFQLSLLLLVFLLPVTALAHDFEFDGIYYNIYDFDSKKVSVTYKGSASGYYNEYSGSVTIPSTFTCNGITFTVTSIGEHAFAGCSGLTSVTISNGVDSICDYAFLDCSSLTSITIPNSVTIIGEYAFYGTAWYNNQPDGVVYAGLVAYNYKGTMPSGTSIILRDGTIGIADWAFQQFTGLASVTIPNSVITIGDEAFLACSGLTSIDIPNSVTSIGFEVFAQCPALTSISVASGNPIYDSRNNCNAIIETANNKLIAGCMNSVIPNTVTRIGNSAFQGCSGLTSITIPISVTSIGNWAFSECSGLTEIYSLALTPPTVYPYTFNGCYRATLYVPKQALNVYKTANYWKNFTNIIGVDDEPGDVDGDGSVTIADVTVLIDLLLGGDIINNEVADFNGDSVVSIKDVTDLIDMLLGS